MNTRKNQASMTSDERAAFVQAVLALKNSVPSQLGLTNRYDDYVQIHMESMMLPDGSPRVPGWAHRGPAFCPWHRVLLRNLELDLQAIDPNVTLPYWDWTVNNSSDPSAPGTPWSEDFMGGDGDAMQGGKVTNGVFAFDSGKWPLNVSEDGTSFLVRTFGLEVTALPTPANVQGALNEDPYDSPQWNAGAQPSFRDRLEGWHGAGSIHNRVHRWVGGSMLFSTSPNDPVFFLHHCNVDRLWAEWQRAHLDEPYVPGPNVPGAPQGHKMKDPMLPWGGAVTVEIALDHKAMGYRYDTDPPEEAPFVERVRFTGLPSWQYKPTLLRQPVMRTLPLFGISPEDEAAGGHDRGR